ncbi:MAG: 16S rRNA (cytidine(1402)-2'-O)-methyltransferase [Ignavibacteriales bacterium]|nr:16S rRNA (cytidine(1402)-2'-O)-methyltransferase [Ignavibacteriales bacterium]
MIESRNYIAGKLFLVAIPIGNDDDITFRAKKILEQVDIIICEEDREGSRLLSRFHISKQITETLNEHNEEESSLRIMNYLKQGRDVALISDTGTPVISDPGRMLVEMAIENNIQIIPVPGPSSIIPALVVSGFPMNKFLFYGFVSPKTELRRKDLLKIENEERTIILMEAPYRIVPLLKDIADVMGKNRKLCISFNLTMPDEKIYRGEAEMLYKYFAQNKTKGEFVIVIEGKYHQNNFKFN